MNTYVILFRGINVGGRNILPMKSLVAVLEEHGFSKVKTYIQSGNVVLRSPSRPGPDLASLIQSEFGFSPELMVLSAPEFITAMEQNPFPEADGKSVHFYFCASKPEPDAQKFEKYRAESETCRIFGNVCYLHAPDGIGRSKLASNVEAYLGVSATGRNLNTVSKLRQMIE